MNNNQYGFTPQKSTTDAAVVVKDFVEEDLKAGEVLVLVSLDVKGAFDAAWWPSILTFIVPAHRLWCIHLNSHGTKAPTTVRCSHLNAQYTHVEA